MCPTADSPRVGQQPAAPQPENGFLRGPLQRVKDEPFHVHSLMTLVRGEEAEEDNLLPHPREQRKTLMSQRGGKRNNVPTLKLKGLNA